MSGFSVGEETYFPFFSYFSYFLVLGFPLVITTVVVNCMH